MNGKKILIADDEARMRRLVGDFLKREGYQVIEAADGNEALEKFSEDESIDMLIIDVMMPKLDGWTVCREVRKISKVPIIMLTARGQESDELFGFDLGADEYVTKPFSPNVLVARINSIFRRLGEEEKTIYEWDTLKIDTKAHCVYVDEKVVNLSPKEYELLIYLVENQGIALSREKILSFVWDFNYYGDYRTVDTHIKRLRSKLKEYKKYIKTVRGLGYKFEV